MTLYRVHYQVATYRGSVDVHADDDAEHEDIVARAKRRIFKHGAPAPMYHESYRVERLDAEEPS